MTSYKISEIYILRGACAFDHSPKYPSGNPNNLFWNKIWEVLEFIPRKTCIVNGGAEFYPMESRKRSGVADSTLYWRKK